MELDAKLCYCFHVSKRKIVNFIRQRQPKRASQVSECFGAGTGCGWCIPFLTRLHSEMMGDEVIVHEDITPEEYEAMRAKYRSDVAAGVRGRNAHGGSAAPGSLRWTRHHDFVADIAEVAEGFERPPVLIGHSMGGYLVQKYMENHEVSAAVLVASVPISGTFAASLRFARRHPLQFAKLLATMRLWPVVATEELAREFLFGTAMPQETVAELHELLQDESFSTYIDMMGLALPRLFPQLGVATNGSRGNRQGRGAGGGRRAGGRAHQRFHRRRNDHPTRRVSRRRTTRAVGVDAHARRFRATRDRRGAYPTAG